MIVSVFAQYRPPNADSLKLALSRSVADTDRLRNLIDLANAYSEYKPDSTIYYDREMLALGKKNHLDEIIGFAYRSDAYAYRYKDNYAEALRLELLAVKIAEKGKDTVALANNYNLLGVIYKSMENYPKALYYNRLCKKIALSCNDTEDLVYAYMNTGAVFEKMNVLDSAIFYEKAALKLGHKFNRHDYANYQNFVLGNVYAKQGNYQLALKHYWMARRLSAIKKDLNNESDECYALANYYIKFSHPDSAMHYANAALSYAREAGAIKATYTSAQLLSRLYEQNTW